MRRLSLSCARRRRSRVVGGPSGGGVSSLVFDEHGDERVKRCSICVCVCLEKESEEERERGESEPSQPEKVDLLPPQPPSCLEVSWPARQAPSPWRARRPSKGKHTVAMHWVARRVEKVLQRRQPPAPNPDGRAGKGKRERRGKGGQGLQTMREACQRRRPFDSTGHVRAQSEAPSQRERERERRRRKEQALGEREHTPPTFSRSHGHGRLVSGLLTRHDARLVVRPSIDHGRRESVELARGHARLEPGDRHRRGPSRAFARRRTRTRTCARSPTTDGTRDPDRLLRRLALPLRRARQRPGRGRRRGRQALRRRRRTLWHERRRAVLLVESLGVAVVGRRAGGFCGGRRGGCCCGCCRGVRRGRGCCGGDAGRCCAVGLGLWTGSVHSTAQHSTRGSRGAEAGYEESTGLARTGGRGTQARRGRSRASSASASGEEVGRAKCAPWSWLS